MKGRKVAGKIVFFVLVFFVFISCGGKSQEENQNNIPVKPIDQNGLQHLLSHRNGNILLLNVWATWCIPCREEFPDLIKLANEYRSRNVEIVGISADYPDEVESKIVPFLQKMEVPFVNYVQNFQDDAQLIELLHPKWNGALPASFIFDEKGIQRVFLPGKHSYSRFKLELEKILATDQ